MERLLDKLYELAMNGDVRAAKLYLDFSLRSNSEQSPGLTLEEAIALINQQNSDDEL